MTTAIEHRLQGIAQLIVQKNLFSKSKIVEYQNLALANKQSLLNYLVTHHLATGSILAQMVAEHFNLPFIDLDHIDIDAVPLNLINESLVYQFKVLPIFVRTEYLFLATDDPSQQAIFKEIQFQTRFPIKLVVVETDKLQKLIDEVLNKKENQYLLNCLNQPIELENPDPVSIDLNKSDEVPIVKFVNQILLAAIKNGASDIHFEPYEKTYRIRYRLDGLLTEIATPPICSSSQIGARIKVLANLDISERRIPQDGHFQMKLASNYVVDFRVSTCPTIGGEKLVVRIINTASIRLSIDSLGLNKLQTERFLTALGKPQGLILVTGPTGSGKTLSLYTALTLLNSKEKNISTVEDPVEIKLPGINQVNVNQKSGLNFATVLRSLLRQDPDIMMIGEIRDLETAEIAIKAAQTGHLVLSTLHTNSAAETLTRLVNIGIPAFNIANSAILLVAQRLARRLCEYCKIRRNDLSQQHLKTIGFCGSEALNLYQAKGCQYCTNGFRGRLGLFELLPLSKKISEQIMNGASSLEIQRLAQAEGMITIYQSGLEKVKQGLTTLEELNRVANHDE
ncbi:type IV-A pilus assembly ATPase PilB [Legionella nautarum]